MGIETSSKCNVSPDAHLKRGFVLLFSEDSTEYSVWSRDSENFSSEVMFTVESVLSMYCIIVKGGDMHKVVHDDGE